MELVSLKRLDLDRAAMCQLFIKTAVVNVNRLSEKKFDTYIGDYMEASKRGHDDSLKRSAKSKSKTRETANLKKRKKKTNVPNENNETSTLKLDVETTPFPSGIPVELPISSDEELLDVTSIEDSVPIEEKDGVQVRLTTQIQRNSNFGIEVRKPRNRLEVVERSDEEFGPTKKTGSKKKNPKRTITREKKKTKVGARKKINKSKTPRLSPTTGLFDNEVIVHRGLCPITGLFDGETAPTPSVPLVTIPAHVAAEYRNVEMELLESPEFISTGLEDDIFSTITVEENTIDSQSDSNNKSQSPKNVWPSISIKPEFINTSLVGDVNFMDRSISEDSRVILEKQHCDSLKVFLKPEVINETHRVPVIVRPDPNRISHGEAEEPLTYYESRLSQAKNRITSFMKESTEQRLSNFAVHIAYAWVEFLVLRSLYNRSFNADNKCFDQKVGTTMQSRFAKLLDHIADNEAFLLKCSEELTKTLSLQYFLTRLLGAVKNISDGENFVFDNNSCMQFYEIVQGKYLSYFSACFPGISIRLRNGVNRTGVTSKVLPVENVQTDTEEYSHTKSKCPSDTYETTQQPSNEIEPTSPTNPYLPTVISEPVVPSRRKGHSRDQPPKSTNPPRSKASTNRKQTSLFQKSLKDAKVHASMLQTHRQLIVNINQNFQAVPHESQDVSTSPNQYSQHVQITQPSANPVPMPHQKYEQVDRHVGTINKISDERRWNSTDKRIGQESRQAGENHPTNRVAKKNSMDRTSRPSFADNDIPWRTDKLGLSDGPNPVRLATNRVLPSYDEAISRGAVPVVTQDRLPKHDIQRVNTLNGPLPAANNTSTLYTSSVIQHSQSPVTTNSGTSYSSCLAQRGLMPVNRNCSASQTSSLTPHSSLPVNVNSTSQYRSSSLLNSSVPVNVNSSLPYSSSTMRHSAYTSPLPVTSNSSLLHGSSLTQHGQLPRSAAYSSSPLQNGIVPVDVNRSVQYSSSRTQHSSSPVTVNSSAPYTSSSVQTVAHNSLLSTTVNNHMGYTSSMMKHFAQNSLLSAPASSHPTYTSSSTRQDSTSKSAAKQPVPAPHRTGTSPVYTESHYVPCSINASSDLPVTSADTARTGEFDYHTITKRAVAGYQENNPCGDVPSQKCEILDPNTKRCKLLLASYDAKLIKWMRNPTSGPASTSRNISTMSPLSRDGLPPALRVDQSEPPRANTNKTSAGAPVILPKQFTSVVTITQDVDRTTISTSRAAPAKLTLVSQPPSMTAASDSLMTVATLPGLDIHLRSPNVNGLSENTWTGQRNSPSSTGERLAGENPSKQSLLGALLMDSKLVNYNPECGRSGTGKSSREESSDESQRRNLDPTATEIQQAIANIPPAVSVQFRYASGSEDSTSSTESSRAPERRLSSTVPVISIRQVVDWNSSTTDDPLRTSQESAAAYSSMSASRLIDPPVQSAPSRSKEPWKQTQPSPVSVKGVQRTASIPTHESVPIQSTSRSDERALSIGKAPVQTLLPSAVSDVHEFVDRNLSQTEARLRSIRESAADCDSPLGASSVSLAEQSVHKINKFNSGKKTRSRKRKLASVASSEQAVNSTPTSVSRSIDRVIDSVIAFQSDFETEKPTSEEKSSPKPRKQLLRLLETVQEIRQDVPIIPTPASLPVRSASGNVNLVSRKETTRAEEHPPITVTEILRQRCEDDVQERNGSSGVSDRNPYPSETLPRSRPGGDVASDLPFVQTSTSSSSAWDMLVSGNTTERQSSETAPCKESTSVTNSDLTVEDDDDIVLIEELSVKRVIPVIALDDDDEPESVSSTVRSKTCAFCSLKATGQCSDCMDASYCSKSCMERHWFASHHAECAGRRARTKKAFGNKPAAKPWNKPWL